jgi:hypothetical protein
MIMAFDLTREYNSGSRLKSIVKRAAHYGVSKGTVVKFFKEAARKYGYSGMIPVYKDEARKPSRRDLILSYACIVSTHAGKPIYGGTYAAWKGTTVNAVLIKNGYDPLSDNDRATYKLASWIN